MDALQRNPVNQIVRAKTLEFRFVPFSADFDFKRGIQSGQFPRDLSFYRG